LEGEVAAYLAELLQLPYLGVVCGVTAADGKVTVTKEFSGGLRGQFEMPLPARAGHSVGRETAPLRAGGQGTCGHEIRQDRDRGHPPRPRQQRR